MRFLILKLILLSSCFSLANDITNQLGISEKFIGRFSQIEASGEAAPYKCPNSIEITASEFSIEIHDLKGGFVEQFIAHKSGCDNTKGDIGPVRLNCNLFSESEINWSITEPVTIVGYTSSMTGIRFDTDYNFETSQMVPNQDVIVYQHDVTEIPFGILGIWNSEKFYCRYQRMSE